ncbi:DUF871 domain-containing protein [Culicoidibacter larvae]|uniref:DUF871 domain-containing protein n=1 Tax=Culicoidibacter larvae TaxID=2579976 RepID=A0A5R8QAP0_9FIRM|nr:MupG family TIM beta-alpha barrel fold protein [Culicoidibacter larvae]TLG72927.1 DUF871 domain-containing protein [Culicoidibacter larvae]
MSCLGISIYPEHSTPEKDKEYISLAAKYGFSRIFTCLLSVTKPAAEIKAEFKDVIEHANRLGFEVIVDVAPRVFKDLGITYDDLSFFSEIGAAGIRLDEGFNGSVEAMMTFNPAGLLIEVNASNPGMYLNNIFSYEPDKSKLIACHNFYPQKYSGLGFDLFYKCSKNLKDLGMRVAAFVSSQTEGTYGPWPVNEGLCTLEMHRELPIDAQARHLFATGVVDDVIIANAYASEEEMAALAKVQPAKLTFGIELEITDLSDVEQEILYDFNHFVRGDLSDYMARSTMPRVIYKEASIPARNTRDLHRGDIIMVNEDYGQYKGEVHIVLQDMPNDGRKNVIGHIPIYEHVLLDYVTPWKKFSFMK